MKTAFFALFLLLVAAVAQAQTVTPAAQAAVKHANAEHPAVVAARQYREGAIDPNRFIVAPPASTRWTSGPAVTIPAVQTATASAR